MCCAILNIEAAEQKDTMERVLVGDKVFYYDPRWPDDPFVDIDLRAQDRKEERKGPDVTVTRIDLSRGGRTFTSFVVIHNLYQDPEVQDK
jgi:hypothetical protein